MGEGTILEHGTHDELLRNEDSAYSRLVRAQNLREGDEEGGSSPDSRSEKGAVEPLEDKALGRKETLDSDILGQSLKDSALQGERSDYSSLYLFKRMGRLNREAWLDYVLGGIFAIRARPYLTTTMYRLTVFLQSPA